MHDLWNIYKGPKKKNLSRRPRKRGAKPRRLASSSGYRCGAGRCSGAKPRWSLIGRGSAIEIWCGARECARVPVRATFQCARVVVVVVRGDERGRGRRTTTTRRRVDGGVGARREEVVGGAAEDASGIASFAAEGGGRREARGGGGGGSARVVVATASSCRNARSLLAPKSIHVGTSRGAASRRGCLTPPRPRSAARRRSPPPFAVDADARRRRRRRRRARAADPGARRATRTRTTR